MTNASLNPGTSVPGSPSAATPLHLKFSGQPIRCLPVPKLVLGKLPPGEHPVTWQELVDAFGKTTVKRKLIVSGLRDFGLMLRGAGGKWLFVDGSFTTARERPSDWDGCFLTAGIDWNTIDPRLKDVKANRKSIKDSFKCDVFVAEVIEGKTGRPFRDFFQHDKTGKPKGILVLDLGTVT